MGACTFFVPLPTITAIKNQIAHTLGLGLSNLRQAGRPEGLPF